MRKAYDFAKYFLKIGADSLPNTYDGNMQLQKLLVFSDLAYIAEYGKRLFSDDILAFSNGCVVEDVRLKYKNDYANFYHDSQTFQPDFSEQEYSVLNQILSIFGTASAKELSDINHAFCFWKEAFSNGTNASGYHNKSRSIVDMTSQQDDIERMRDILWAYQDSAKSTDIPEIINGISFYHDPGFVFSDVITNQLEMFSRTAEDPAYSVYMDNGELVIF